LIPYRVVFNDSSASHSSGENHSHSSRCSGESAERPPKGRDWRYELKLDGFRAIGRKSGRSTQLWSRNQKDFTHRLPGVVKGITNLPNDTVIDGEIVALDENGRPSFNLLQGLGDAQAKSSMHPICSCSMETT
jgi:ATP-dependent DNA ligase